MNRHVTVAGERIGWVSTGPDKTEARNIPAERKRPTRRITEPEAPDRGVSATEFQEMVRDLHADVPPAPAATAERDPTADLDPEDLVMKDKPKRDKPKRPRNRKHGRAH